MKQGFFHLRSLKGSVGVLALGMVIVWAGSIASGALAQGKAQMGNMADPSPSPTTSPIPTHWYTVVGDTFQPSSSGYSYQFYTNGCVTSNTPGQWRASINLPDGSVLAYVSINYFNLATSDSSTIYVTRYGTTTIDLKYVNSRKGATTGVGYFQDMSGAFREVVDNFNYGYVFVWTGSTTQKLCSAQVGYYPAAFGIALPMITR
jgi:hypothetical protein